MPVNSTKSLLERFLDTRADWKKMREEKREAKQIEGLIQTAQYDIKKLQIEILAIRQDAGKDVLRQGEFDFKGEKRSQSHEQVETSAIARSADINRYIGKLSEMDNPVAQKAATALKSMMSQVTKDFESAVGYAKQINGEKLAQRVPDVVQRPRMK